MKKALPALVLALALLVSTVALAEDGAQTFRPYFLSAMDYTASEWFSTSSNRALFSVLLCTGLPSDVFNTFSAAEMFHTYPSYVAKSGDDLLLMGYSDGKLILLGYSTVIKTGFYLLSDNSSELNSAALLEVVMEQSLKQSEMATDGYYKNNSSDITQALMNMSSMFGDNS